MRKRGELLSKHLTPVHNEALIIHDATDVGEILTMSCFRNISFTIISGSSNVYNYKYTTYKGILFVPLILSTLKINQDSSKTTNGLENELKKHYDNSQSLTHGNQSKE